MILSVVSLFLLCISSLHAAVEGDSSGLDFSELSIEELMQLEVTSVSKKPEKAFNAPSAVFVLTAEDIRRSGATNIPEALRLVPGLHVARIDASKWAISSRGFGGRFTNKLLVLIDGRTIYTPLFSGVYWDVQDVLLEDIERIEVIRGPGATLWGANAVNGVINITTRSAGDTQGGLVDVGGGTEELGWTSFRYGAQLNEDTWFRVYGKGFERDSGRRDFGGSGDDDWRGQFGGFRVDCEASERDALSLQGGAYHSHLGSRATQVSLTPPYTTTDASSPHASGGHVLGRWRHTCANSSKLCLQVYFDRMRNDDTILRRAHNTFDVDMHHHIILGERHDVVWGLGYRYVRYDIGNTDTVAIDPEDGDENVFSAFLQDEIVLVPEHLRLTLGTKLEHNDYTGVEIQPSARLLWTPNGKHAAWAAVSRAVRTPSKIEEDGMVSAVVIPPATAQNPTPWPAVYTLVGDEDFDSEDLLSWELGYRVHPLDALSLDVALFYNEYDNLRTFEQMTPTPGGPSYIVPAVLENNAEGEVYGVEVKADWQVRRNWRLMLGYSFLQMQIHTSDSSSDTQAEDHEGASPHNQFFARSWFDLREDVQLDATLRYVDNLPTFGIHSYLVLDLRLGWQATDNLDLSVVARNLLDSHHLEYVPEFINTEPTGVEHGVYARLTYRF